MTTFKVRAAVTRLGFRRNQADPPTAMFAGNNRLTIGTIRAVRRHGTPVAVVGFDDFELADQLNPPVTVVAQEEVGR